MKRLALLLPLLALAIHCKSGGIHPDFGLFAGFPVKAALGISGVSASVYACRVPPGPDGEPGAQIDLVLDRADGIVDLCEMKHTGEAFAVTADYREKLLDKVAAFRRAFGGRKAVHIALVTSAGLRPNANADVVQAEIRLADLFRDA